MTINITESMRIDSIRSAPVSGEMNNVVQSVTCMITFTNDDTGDTIHRSMVLKDLAGDPENFIEHADLTEEVVLGWFTSALETTLAEPYAQIQQEAEAGLLQILEENSENAASNIRVPWL